MEIIFSYVEWSEINLEVLGFRVLGLFDVRLTNDPIVHPWVVMIEGIGFRHSKFRMVRIMGI